MLPISDVRLGRKAPFLTGSYRLIAPVACDSNEPKNRRQLTYQNRDQSPQDKVRPWYQLRIPPRASRFAGVKVERVGFMAKIAIKELKSLTANDAGRISVRKDGVSVSFFYRYRWGGQNKEYACGVLAAQIPDGHSQGTKPGQGAH